MITIMVLAFSASAFAEPKYVKVAPPTMVGDTVMLGEFSPSFTLVDVEIYDDVRGIPTRSIGAQMEFKLKKGEGFNFVYRAPDGREYFQMITEYSETGDGLYINCDRKGGNCKYLYPTDNQLSKLK